MWAFPILLQSSTCLEPCYRRRLVENACPKCGGRTRVLSQHGNFTRHVCVSSMCDASPFEVEDFSHIGNELPTLPELPPDTSRDVDPKK